MEGSETTAAIGATAVTEKRGAIEGDSAEASRASVTGREEEGLDGIEKGTTGLPGQTRTTSGGLPRSSCLRRVSSGAVIAEEDTRKTDEVGG